MNFFFSGIFAQLLFWKISADWSQIFLVSIYCSTVFSKPFLSVQQNRSWLFLSSPSRIRYSNHAWFYLPQKVQECSLLNSEINSKLSHFCRSVPGGCASEADTALPWKGWGWEAVLWQNKIQTEYFQQLVRIKDHEPKNLWVFDFICFELGS